MCQIRYVNIFIRGRDYLVIWVIPLLLTIFRPNVFFDNVFNLHDYMYIGSSALLLFIKLSCRESRIPFTCISSCVIMLLVCLCVRNYDTICVSSMRWLGDILLLLFLSPSKIDVRKISSAISVICLVEIIVCVYQLLIFNNSTFIITGTFDNPTGLSVLFAVSLPFLCYRIENRPWIYLVIFTFAVLLVIAKERKGLLCLFVLCPLIFQRQRSKKLTPFLCLAVPILFTIFFFLEPESTLGRIFILKGTFSIMGHNLLFGDGIYTFGKSYMLWQSSHFANNSSSEYAYLADNVVHPLNELFNYAVSQGLLLCIPLAIAIFSILVSARHKATIWHMCLLSIALASLFCYCFSYSFVPYFVILSISQIKSRQLLVTKGITAKLILTCLCLITLLWIGRGFMFEYKWKNAYNEYLQHKAGKFSGQYESLSKIWDGNPYFFYNYASVMRNELELQKSNMLLDKYREFYVDYNGTLLYAKNLYDMGQYKEAEKYYNTAHYMCPNRFEPLQGVLRIAMKQNNHVKAVKVANEIANKPVKIESYKTKAIIYEANEKIREIQRGKHQK